MNAHTPTSPISVHTVVPPAIMNPWNCKALPFQTRSISLRVRPPNTLNKPFKTANVLFGVALFRYTSACNSPALIAEVKGKQSWEIATRQQFSTIKVYNAYKQKMWDMLYSSRAKKQYNNIVPSLSDIKHFTCLDLETAAHRAPALCYFNSLKNTWIFKVVKTKHCQT